MKTVIASAVAAMVAAPAMAGVDVSIGDSTQPWEGFMNVFELNGDFVFASGWGVPDLVANFDDGAQTVTVSPNTVNDPAEFWYQGGGGPGAPGNKLMEANLFQNITDGSLSGTTVTFSGNVLDFTMAPTHEVSVFIKDFDGGFALEGEARQVIDSTGNFSISLDTIAGAGRNVQFGITVFGVNVWSTDVDPFGNAVFQTPAPGAAVLLGMGGLVAARRRR